MNISNKQILCIGEILWDRFPSGSKPGGAALNVAVHLKAFGNKVLLASRVGQDEAGNALITFLKNSGISTGLIQKDNSLPTSEVLVHLDKNKNATFEICEPVAWDNIKLTDSLISKAEKTGVIVYGSLASRNLVSRETIINLLGYDAVNIMDVNFRKPYDNKEIIEKLLNKTDIVKLNNDELHIIADWQDIQNKDEKSLAKWIASNYNIKIVCVTRGEKGALIYTEGNFCEHPGFKVNTVDTVGAGDAFLAGFISSLVNKKSPEDSLTYACATGAFVASKEGATPDYDFKEINKIAKSLS